MTATQVFATIANFFLSLKAAIPEQVYGLLALYFLWKYRHLFGIITRKLLSGLSNEWSADVLSIVESGLNILIQLFAGLIVLGTFDVDVSSIVAGLGLTGFALAYALEDVVGNFVSGILILIFKPFKRGDIVTVNQDDQEYKGVVDRMDLRYVWLSGDDDDEFALIPNSIVFSSIISVKEGKAPAVEKQELKLPPLPSLPAFLQPKVIRDFLLFYVPRLAYMLAVSVYLLLGASLGMEHPAEPYLKCVPMSILLLTTWRLQNVWWPKGLLMAALALSGCGDYLLSTTVLPLPPNTQFLAGLVCFLLAHLFYILLFARELKLRKNLPLMALVLGGQAVYTYWLLPQVDADLRIPVIVYTAILGMMMGSLIAGGLHRRDYGIAGGLLFIVSDGSLALDKFAFQVPHITLTVVLPTYFLAQFLIHTSVVLSSRPTRLIRSHHKTAATPSHD